MQIGQYTLPNNLCVAPMAGVTDRPFRMLCKRLGAGYAVSEMVTSRRDLWDSLKTSRRANHDGETAPIAVQIAGTDAQEMADAARYNVDRGAQIIDINMGCPAKKVCNKWAGSALMQQPELAVQIAAAVVAACAPAKVPVTLKMRTGWSETGKNALPLALAFEAEGIAMLSIHGRTREQGYKGLAEHHTVAEVKSRVNIPVVANGDIDSPESARNLLKHTGADALMIGRAAQGNPWIFREISYFLTTGKVLAPPSYAEMKAVLLQHLAEHVGLYGEFTGTRSARKHIAWYTQRLPQAAAFRIRMNAIEHPREQHHAVAEYFDALMAQEPMPFAA